MLTLEMAEELVEWAEKNNIPFSALILPHIVFIAIVVIFMVAVFLTI